MMGKGIAMPATVMPGSLLVKENRIGRVVELSACGVFEVQPVAILLPLPVDSPLEQWGASEVDKFTSAAVLIASKPNSQTTT